MSKGNDQPRTHSVRHKNTQRRVTRIPRRFLVPSLLVLAAAGVYAVGTRTAAQPQNNPEDAIVANGGRVLFVAPDGKAGAAGTRQEPLDLASALSGHVQVRPGDRIWIRGGLYRNTYASYVNGTEAAPITIEPYPGEHVVIDSSPSREPALAVMGAWTTVSGLEITNSDPSRFSVEPGSSAGEDLRRGSGVDIRGSHSKVINSVVHDLAAGFGVWSDAESSQVYGNIIYYNGWTGRDRNHGHGVYAQNKTGVREIGDNVIFSQVGYGIHIYGSDAAYLDNIDLEGNVVFNNGIVNEKGYERNILLGGGRVAQNPVLKDNFTYYTPNLDPKSTSNRGSRWGGENYVGYDSGCSNIVMDHNYFAHWGGGEALILTRCAGSIKNNMFYGLIGGDVQMRDLYPDNVYVFGRPSETKVFVRPNKYERGRANIIVYNWEHRRHVSADLSTVGLKPGQPFEIRDVEDFFGDPVVSGTFTNPVVDLPMTGLSAVRPVGNLQRPPHTGPEFAVFVVLPAQPTETLWSRWVGLARKALAERGTQRAASVAGARGNSR